ncbi:MAG: hypothetical protein JNM81_11105 [Rhodospirillaceae bacterium]|nr:hypothetical protein [Rhodospirillaceae bacterium]
MTTSKDSSPHTGIGNDNIANDNKAAASTHVIDLGPRERARHRGGLKLGARVQTDGGIVLHQGAAASVECVLDALRESGLLNGCEGAPHDRASVGRSRYEQGLWLRQLYFRAGLNSVRALDLASRGSGAGSASARYGDHDFISDDAARARMKYNRVVRDLGGFADAVTSFVCFDQIKRGEQHLTLLRKGLDRLCALRG